MKLTEEMGDTIMDSSTKQYLVYSLSMILLPSLALAQAQTGATSPNSAGGEAGQATHESASGDDAIYCRPPQQRTDFRMMGPKVCMTLGKWKELRSKGLDVSADGRSVQQMQNGPGAGSMGTSYGLSPQP